MICYLLHCYEIGESFSGRTTFSSTNCKAVTITGTAGYQDLSCVEIQDTGMSGLIWCILTVSSNLASRVPSVEMMQVAIKGELYNL